MSNQPNPIQGCVNMIPLCRNCINIDTCKFGICDIDKTRCFKPKVLKMLCEQCKKEIYGKAIVIDNEIMHKKCWLNLINEKLEYFFHKHFPWFPTTFVDDVVLDEFPNLLLHWVIIFKDKNGNIMFGGCDTKDEVVDFLTTDYKASDHKILYIFHNGKELNFKFEIIVHLTEPEKDLRELE